MAYYNNPYGYGQQFYGGSYMPQQISYGGVPQPVPQSQNNSGMIWVDGEIGARAFQMPSGATGPIALWDTNDTVVYLKSCNQAGMPNPPAENPVPDGGAGPYASRRAAAERIHDEQHRQRAWRRRLRHKRRHEPAEGGDHGDEGAPDEPEESKWQPEWAPGKRESQHKRRRNKWLTR